MHKQKPSSNQEASRTQNTNNVIVVVYHQPSAEGSGVLAMKQTARMESRTATSILERNTDLMALRKTGVETSAAMVL